jgi:hypothetical protein
MLSELPKCIRTGRIVKLCVSLLSNLSSVKVVNLAGNGNDLDTDSSSFRFASGKAEHNRRRLKAPSARTLESKLDELRNCVHATEREFS